MDKMANTLRSGELILVEGDSIDKLPAPLHLIYGFPVLPIYRPGPKTDMVISNLIQKLKDSRDTGKEIPIVYLITDKVPPRIPGANIKLTDKISYHATLFERSGVHLPRSLDDQARDGNIKVKIFRLLPN